MRYVHVPVRANGPGFNPRMRQTKGDSCETVGKSFNSRLPSALKWLRNVSVILPP